MKQSHSSIIFSGKESCSPAMLLPPILAPKKAIFLTAKVVKEY
ncbi:hypothetical protein [Porphyromonas miyakawae]